MHVLPLRECAYEGASIEVHLRGAEKRRQSTRNTPAAGGEDLSQASMIMQLQEDMELLQKEQEKNAADYARQIKDLH